MSEQYLQGSDLIVHIRNMSVPDKLVICHGRFASSSMKWVNGPPTCFWCVSGLVGEMQYFEWSKP